jgi:hypothetical protein
MDAPDIAVLERVLSAALGEPIAVDAEFGEPTPK